LSSHDWLPLMLQKRLLHRWRGAIDLFVANSHVIKHALDQNGFGPAEVLWNGTPEREPRGPLEDPPSVAFVGRLVPEKGVDVAIRAFSAVIAQVPGAKLVIVGDGPERATAERLVASLHLTSHVEMCGQLSRVDAELAVRRCWMQIAPSQWIEPFGNVAIEAQMRGTAIVASRCGGFCESVVDGHTGLLVPPHDEHAWAHAMISLLRDRDRAEAMGRAGRARALVLFSQSAMVDQLIGIYQRVIQTRAMTG
jgi:glycosyltransferase involved in cell wall biosynthesis